MKFLLAFLCLLALVIPFASCISPLYDRFHGWRHIGPASSTDPIRFTVALKQQNVYQLEQLFWAVADPNSDKYQQFLTASEVNAFVASDSALVDRVVQFFERSGIPSSSIQRLSDALIIRSTVSVVESIFGGDFHVYEHPQKLRRSQNPRIVRLAELGSYAIPAQIAESVDFIEGFTHFPVLKPNALKKIGSDANSATDVILPALISQLYSIDDLTLAAPVSQGVIEWVQQFYTESDLKEFLTLNNLPYTPLQPNHIVGGNENTPGDESQMDIEWVQGVNPNGVAWFFYDSSSWVYGFALAFANAPDVPNVISISYGIDEQANCDPAYGVNCTIPIANYFNRSDVEFIKIGLRGVSVFVCSQDSGANGRSDESCSDNHLNVAFPGSSAYVSTVGATMLPGTAYSLPNAPNLCSNASLGLSCVSAGVERAVNLTYAYFTSGGGFSNHSAQPAYQAAAVKKYFSLGVPLPPSSYYNPSHRGVPDLAAIGSHGMVVMNGGVSNQGGGTSLSTPIVAGLFARLVAESIALSGKPLGFVNPLIYQMQATAPSTFNDITIGDNICPESGCNPSCTGYVAAKGWDPVTGLGTPNYAAMKQYITKLFKEKRQN
jgi:tripeptidyl-peptidase I